MGLPLGQAAAAIEDAEDVRIVTHLDADGLASAAIALAAMLRLEKNVKISIVQQLKNYILEKMEFGEDVIIFTDLGSGHLDRLAELDTVVIIADHHPVVGKTREDRFYHINPHLVGWGSDKIAGAGVMWHLARAIDRAAINEVGLAIVGAIGDVQERGWELCGENANLVKLGIDNGLIRVERGIRLFGRKNRPLYKALVYSTDPYIPGISGNESAAVQLLAELGIPIRDGNKWVALEDLDKEEQRKLASALILQRIGENDPGEIFGDVYHLRIGDQEVDGHEFATMLNAAGRLGCGSIGIRACLGDADCLLELEKIIKKYRRFICNYLDWIRKGNYIKKDNGIIYIMGGKRINENLLGTVTSICQRSFWPGQVVIGFANTKDGEVKVSGRAGNSNIHLQSVFAEVVKKIGGESGGHARACGAYIQRGEEAEFAKILEKAIR